MSIKEKVYEYVAKKEKKSIFISELGEKIYFTPLTVLEMQVLRIRSEIQTSGNNFIPRIDQGAFSVWTVILKSEDEQGNKIFTDADKPILDQMKNDVIIKIANAIHETKPMEELIKKFKEGGDPFVATSSPSPTEKDVSSAT
jgi:hypothetical protein